MTLYKLRNFISQRNLNVSYFACVYESASSFGMIVSDENLKSVLEPLYVANIF